MDFDFATLAFPNIGDIIRVAFHHCAVQYWSSGREQNDSAFAYITGGKEDMGYIEDTVNQDSKI